MDTRTVSTPEATIAYDVYGPLPTADGRPVLLMVGHPMCAEGFTALAGHFPERTVVALDPRGLGRSTRHDGRTERTPEMNAEDAHAVVADLGAGSVDFFGSSGGAVTGLALARAHPEDVSVLVAHEPPACPVLPDAELAEQAVERFHQAYDERGFGAGMAAFVAAAGHEGEYTQEFLDQPLPDPAAFGMPTQDDGSRDDPLLSRDAVSVTSYQPDVDALREGPTRVVLGVGEESTRQFPGRCATALAALLGTEATVFPGHHGGFHGEGQGPYSGRATDFAVTLRRVLEG